MDAVRRLFFFAALLAALTVESAAFVRPAAGPGLAPDAEPSADGLSGHRAQPALATLAATPAMVIAHANEGPAGRTAGAARRSFRTVAGLAPTEGARTPARRALHRRACLDWAPSDRVERTGRPFHGALAPPAPIRNTA